MDETGFSTVPTKVGKVISQKCVKRVGTMTSQERGTLVKTALAVNALGNSIPPFFLFPRKNMQTIFLENASPVLMVLLIHPDGCNRPNSLNICNTLSSLAKYQKIRRLCYWLTIIPQTCQLKLLIWLLKMVLRCCLSRPLQS